MLNPIFDSTNERMAIQLQNFVQWGLVKAAEGDWQASQHSYNQATLDIMKSRVIYPVKKRSIAVSLLRLLYWKLVIYFAQALITHLTFSEYDGSDPLKSRLKTHRNC